jgi:hypothetical protein
LIVTSVVKIKIQCRDGMRRELMSMRGPPSFTSSTQKSLSQSKSALCLASLAFLIVSCTTVGDHTQEYFFNATGELFVLSAGQHYEEAMDRARSWKADAYLNSISAGVAPSTYPDAWLLFMFDSPSSPDSIYELHFIGETWTSRVLAKGPMTGAALPIKREDWSLDSVDAWSIAQAHGGEDLLLRHQDPMTSMTVTLAYWRVGSTQNVLAWRASYLIVYGDSLSIIIDPRTGDILEVVDG